MQIIFAMLLMMGLVFGLLISALGHPRVYRLFFGGSLKSLDR